MKYQSSAYKVGTGLRSSHYSYLEQRPATEASWFEAASEDYLYTHGRPLEILKIIRLKMKFCFRIELVALD